MPIFAGTSAGNKELSEVWLGTALGNKRVTEIWVGTSGGNKLIGMGGPALSPANGATFAIQAEGGGDEDGDGIPDPTFYSALCSVSVTGGVAPYSYLWQWVSGEPVPAILSPTAASTGLSWSTQTPAPSQIRCTVTDSIGQVASATYNLI